MSAPIITCHLSPYVAIQGTAEEIAQDRARMASLGTTAAAKEGPPQMPPRACMECGYFIPCKCHRNEAAPAPSCDVCGSLMIECRCFCNWTPDAEARKPVSGDPVTLTYRNWRGEVAERTITPLRVWFGSTDWHPDPQWLLTAWDAEKVKPLVWTRADLTAWGENAKAGLISYNLTWTYRDDPEVWFKVTRYPDCKVIYEGGDEDAAYGVAQSDYEARILAALEGGEA